MDKHIIKWQYQGVDYEFHTLNSLFSYRHIDSGTIKMIEHTELPQHSKLLDLGCGYGVIGIWAAGIIGAENVVMSDKDVNAVKMAEYNTKLNNQNNIRIVHSNGFDKIEDRDFTIIMTHPPYHTDFSVAKEFIEEGYRHLQMDGWLVMVTKRFDWYKNKINSVFGGVKWIYDDGYYIFIAQKRNYKKIIQNKRIMSKKLQRKYGKM